jgi:hypothetical protein
MCSKNVPTQSSADNIETSNQLGTDNLAVTPHIDPNPLHKFREQNYTGSRQTTSEAGKRRRNSRTETGWLLLVGNGHGRQKQQVPSPGSPGPRKQPRKDPISRFPGSSCLLAATRTFRLLGLFPRSSPVQRRETKERNVLASSSDCSQFKMAAAEVDPVSDFLLL